MIVLGIDPGASGGLAIVSHAEGFPARVVETWKMPGTPADVAMVVCEARDWHGVTFAVLEKVWAAPTQGRKQGAAGMFKFGQGFTLADVIELKRLHDPSFYDAGALVELLRPGRR